MEEKGSVLKTVLKVLAVIVAVAAAVAVALVIVKKVCKKKELADEEELAIDDCCCDCDDDDCCDCEDDGLYEIECPACNDIIYLDEEMLEEDGINCPNCGTPLEFDFDCCCDDCCDCEEESEE